MSFGVTSSVDLVLHTALNGLTERQNVISDDIANIDTPGYRASSVDFEDSLQNAIQSGAFDTDRATAGPPSIVATTTPDETPVGADGNNVDLRKETMSMMQTQYSYQLVGKALSDQFTLLKTATWCVLMGAFDTLSIANTALGAHQTWLDALADNIANVNTMAPMTGSAYQAKFAVFAPQAGGGVDVAGFAESDAAGRVTYSPDNPLADAQGDVRAPDIDIASQMSQLIMAQRGYQSSVQVTKTAQDTYDSALSIGAK